MVKKEGFIQQSPEYEDAEDNLVAARHGKQESERGTDSERTIEGVNLICYSSCARCSFYPHMHLAESVCVTVGGNPQPLS